jgi:hypothetical protein
MGAARGRKSLIDRQISHDSMKRAGGGKARRRSRPGVYEQDIKIGRLRGIAVPPAMLDTAATLTITVKK